MQRYIGVTQANISANKNKEPAIQFKTKKPEHVRNSIASPGNCRGLDLQYSYQPERDKSHGSVPEI